VAGLIRTASYGSWFNFYLCSVSGTITLPGALGGQPIVLNLNTLSSSQARCQ
jgi:phospholipid/cholesterol/gamma-HCH transport system substrate-binding protein